jgi:S1-C subfamily serine protease
MQQVGARAAIQSLRTANCRAVGNGVRALLACVLLPLSACHYEGTLKPPPTYVTSTALSESEKLPGTLAFIDDPNLEKMRISAGRDLTAFTLQVGPVIRQAYLGELAATFANVQTVAQPQESDTADYYAVPSFAWLGSQSQPEDFLVVARLRLVDRRLKKTFASYETSAQASFRPPGSAAAASFFEATTLGVLAPVTEPIKNDAVGKQADAEAQRVIAKVMADLGAAMRKDRGLVAYTNVGPIEDARPGSAPAPVVDKEYEKYLDAVVVLRTADGMGSGFYVGTDGLIATAAHVVAADAQIFARTRSGKELPANVVDIDRTRDLALLKVSPDDGLRSLKIDYQDPRVGTEVLAIGSPEGLSWTVSKGVVSAIRNVRNARVVQTDAVFLPGVSGGPLIDIKSGQVVGIASFAQGPGLSFAIMAEELRKAFPARFKG